MNGTPDLSVVVPVFNEQDNVAQMLREILSALRGVVPPFEVTFLRRVAGASSLCAASLAAPRTVCRASFIAVSRSRPSFSAEAASCSMNQNT